MAIGKLEGDDTGIMIIPNQSGSVLYLVTSLHADSNFRRMEWMTISNKHSTQPVIMGDCFLFQQLASKLQIPLYMTD